MRPSLPRTLRFRAAISGALLGVLALGSAFAVTSNVAAAKDSAEWLLHTEQVIGSAHLVARLASDAQTGARGFLLAGDRAFLAPFQRGSREFERSAAQLSALVANDPSQAARVEAIVSVFEEWRGTIAEPLIARRLHGAMDSAPTPALLEGGRKRMDELRRAVDELIAQEQRYLVERRAASLRASRRLAIWSVAMLGAIVFVGAGGAFSVALRAARDASELADAASAIERGDLSRRARVRSRDELGALAAAFNAMAAQLEDRRTYEARLNRMREMLHGSEDATEAQLVVERLARQALPASAGRLFLVNFSRDLLLPAASWGEGLPSDPFGPAECWGLRSGRPHACAHEGADVACAHAAGSASGTVCLPLTAQGEVVGVLQLALEAPGVPPAALDVAEMLSLTFANLRLKAAMRDQATRDPLTGLFNRRYLDETLPRELARAARGAEPVGVVVFDVDHFKRFNDLHGHAAGDELLRRVGAVLRGTFRASDVVCRFGGEEFVAVLPQCSLVDAVARAEAVLHAVRELVVTLEGAVLGPVTISAGAAALPEHGPGPEALFEAADRALYRSKADGRDRVTAAPVPLRRAG